MNRRIFVYDGKQYAVEERSVGGIADAYGGRRSKALSDPTPLVKQFKFYDDEGGVVASVVREDRAPGVDYLTDARLGEILDSAFADE